MGKYVYKTVYEEFTGQKPPEPKVDKPKNKRGLGHPYRMRLNVKEEENLGNTDTYITQTLNTHAKKQSQPQVRKTLNTPQKKYNPEFNFKDTGQNLIQSFGERNTSAPKVSYKKRRHFQPSTP